MPKDEREITQTTQPLTRGASFGAQVLDVLAILWSREEPARAGEVFAIPSSPAGSRWTIGRETAIESTEERRLEPLRDRPEARLATSPLASPRISRRQLVFSRDPEGRLCVANVGRRKLLVNGHETDEAVVEEGDVLEIRNELLLLRTARPVVFPRVYGAGLHVFGEADAWGLVGESPEMWRLRVRILEAASRDDLHVLISGASGTGKELVAQAIHRASSRSRKDLVPQNAAAIAEGLVDAELFGNRRNFPHAGMPERRGLIGAADGTTLFLDEVAELPKSMQATLLRTLDAGNYRRLGEDKDQTSSFRLVGATNQPDSHMREDFLARFKLRIHMPDLNERREDIPLIARHLLRAHALRDPRILRRFFLGEDATGPARIEPALLTALVRHRYVTHVRELDTLLYEAARRTLERQPDPGPGETKLYVEIDDHVRELLSSASSVEPPGAAGAATSPEQGPRLGSSSSRSSAPPTLPAAAFDAVQEQRLGILRRYNFSPTDCARDPDYGANRANADVHLRQLICRALVASRWDVASAAALLAGAGPTARIGDRIRTYVGTLSERMGALRRDGLSDEDVRRTMARATRGSNEDLERVLGALLAGELSGDSHR